MRQSNSFYLLWLSLFFPAFAFLLASRKLWDKHYQKTILFFSFWFGYFVYFYGGDIIYHKETFDEILRYNWSDYLFLVSNSLSPDKLNNYAINTVNGKPDIYALTLQFIVSRFTDNPRWFFAFVSLFYTFFFLKFLNELLLTIKKINTRAWYIFFWALVFIVPFYVGVTGVRFWTALFIFMWFTVRYIRTNTFSSLLFSATSVLVHYTFLFPVAILLIYRFLNISYLATKILVIFSVIFYIVSSTTGLLDFIEQGLLVFENTNIKSVTSGYLNPDLLNQRIESTSQTNWYVRFKVNSIFLFFMILFLLDFFGFFRWKKDAYLNQWISLYTIFFVITLITSGLGSIGRFQYIFYILSITRLLYLSSINPESASLKRVAYILFPIMILYTIVTFRAGLYFVDPILLIGNPVVFLFVHSNVSLSEFIVGH